MNGAAPGGGSAGGVASALPHGVVTGVRRARALPASAPGSGAAGASGGAVCAGAGVAGAWAPRLAGQARHQVPAIAAAPARQPTPRQMQYLTSTFVLYPSTRVLTLAASTRAGRS